MSHGWTEERRRARSAALRRWHAEHPDWALVHWKRIHAERKKRGLPHPATGRKLSKENRQKMSDAMRVWHREHPRFGPDHPKWRGDKAAYGSKHDWILRNYQKTGICEKCGARRGTAWPSGTEWANISGKYKRSRGDFIELCRSCHRFFDQHPERRGSARREMERTT